MRRFLVTTLIALVVSLGLAACGSDGGGTPAGHFTPDATSKALKDAGWQVKSSKGGTVSKVTQTGFLELHSPAGTAIDVQFIDSDASAAAESAAALKSIKNFHGTTDRNAIIFIAPLGATVVPAAELTTLRGLLR